METGFTVAFLEFVVLGERKATWCCTLLSWVRFGLGFGGGVGFVSLATRNLGLAEEEDEAVAVELEREGFLGFARREDEEEKGASCVYIVNRGLVRRV